MRTFGLLLLAVACTSPSGNDDTGNDDTSNDTGEDSDTGPEPTGEAHGTVLDGSAAPVVGAKVNLCQMVCTTVDSDAYGAFDFGPLLVGDYSFHVVPPSGSGLAEPVVPFTIEDSTDPAIPVVLPALGTPLTLPGTATELEVAPGLFLTLKAGDLEITFEDPPTAVSGVLVDEADWLPLDVSGTVIAVWYLDPYEATAVEAIDGIPIRIRNDFALADGTYEVWRASYWDYAFVKVGDFTAAAGQITNTSARIPELSTIVLVEPEAPDTDPYNPY